MSMLTGWKMKESLSLLKQINGKLEPKRLFQLSWVGWEEDAATSSRQPHAV